MIALFDFIKLVFIGSEKQWNELNDTDKSRNFFMMNRFLSIEFPHLVAILSHMKINSPAVCNYWHARLSQSYKSVPKWIYAKTVKKVAEDKKKKLPSIQFIKWFCEKEEMNRREFDEHVQFFGEDFLEKLREIEKNLISQGILKKIE